MTPHAKTDLPGVMPSAQHTLAHNPMQPPADSPATPGQACRAFLSHASVRILLAALLASLARFGGHPAYAVAAVFIWGMLVFIIVPPLQLRVVGTASEAPNLAATLNQGAFNVGNAVGAWAGATALTAGVTYQGLPFVGAAIALIAVAVALFSQRLDRHVPATPLACPAQ